MRPHTILLVEDDQDSRDIYRAFLRHAGFRVLEAPDGTDALAIAREHHPDLIVMDLGLPRLDGWQATALLKRDPGTSGIPVVAVTVHLQPADRARARTAGCAAFLEKPCTPQFLGEAITRLL